MLHPNRSSALPLSADDAKDLQCILWTVSLSLAKRLERSAGLIRVPGCYLKASSIPQFERPGKDYDTFRGKNENGDIFARP
jgi:hypothetical protein